MNPTPDVNCTYGSPMGRTGRKAWSRVEWQNETLYIQSVLQPGSDFNHSPDTFAKYCRMQAHFAAEDGCADLSREILAHIGE